MPAAAQQQSLGIFGMWGAFRGDQRCYAIAQPYRTLRGATLSAYASVGFWPGRGIRNQLYFRLSAEKRGGSAVLLRIDDRTFQLLAGRGSAWAKDGRADAEILTAMRSGIEMTIESRSERGMLIRDSYRLRGAATAVDAAAIACAGRPR